MNNWVGHTFFSFQMNFFSFQNPYYFFNFFFCVFEYESNHVKCATKFLYNPRIKKKLHMYDVFSLPKKTIWMIF